MKISRGDIFQAHLNPTVGHEIRKTRPVIVVSNNVNNTYAATVTVVPLTSQKLEKVYPFEVLLDEAMTGLPKKSKALANQIRTIDKARLAKKFGFLTKEQMKDLDSAIRIHLAV